MEKWERRQTRLIMNDINRWLNDEKCKQDYIEEKRSKVESYCECIDEILDYDDSDYEDGLEGRDI